MTKHSGKKKRAPAQSGQRRDPDNGRFVRRDQEDNPPPDPPSVPPASADGGDLATGEIELLHLGRELELRHIAWERGKGGERNEVRNEVACG